MSEATRKARNPDAPAGYVRPPRSQYDLTVELMEQAYLGDMYLHYFAIMKDSPFFTDPDMVITSDFELNTSDEDTDDETTEGIVEHAPTPKQNQEKAEDDSDDDHDDETTEGIVEHAPTPKQNQEKAEDDSDDDHVPSKSVSELEKEVPSFS